MSDELTGVDGVRAIMQAPEDVDLPEGMAAPDNVGGWDGVNVPPAPPPEDDGEAPPPEKICASLPLNDYGNGMRFKTHFGKDVLWVPRVGWFEWCGTHWKRDPDEIGLRRKAHQMTDLIAKETWFMDWTEREREALDAGEAAEAILEEVGAIPKKDRTDEQSRAFKEAQIAVDRAAEVRDGHKTAIGRRLTHAKNAGNTNAIKNMLTEAAVTLSQPLEDLDARPLEVNTETGVLSFSVLDLSDEGAGRVAEVKILQHEREQLHSKIIPVAYDPAATCPLFDEFLERIQPIPEMRRFLQRWLGLSMTALTGEQKFAFFYGSGANGKSVLVDVMARLLGDYAASAKIESLTGRNRRGGGDATPDLVPLIGARMVRASEPDEGEKLQEGLIKELTGGEPILVRALHSDFVLVHPQFKLTISGNHRPEIRGGDDGIWRRVLLVPFDIQIPPAERDPKLGEKLWEERSGILNWLIEGLLDYLERGLQVPQAVSEATQAYREDSDPVGTFLTVCCLVSGEADRTISARDLGEAFNFWLDDQGKGTWTPMTVSKRLAAKAERWKSPTTGRTFTARKASSAFYDGIELVEPFKTRFLNMPRDAQGRILRGRAEDAQ